MKPDISVIMSTYNESEKYLRESIESILNQTFQNFEFIIVLDNPENEMIKKVLLEYSKLDCRIKLLFNKKNKGLTRSLNDAWKVAKAEFIARMDADDISEPERLKTEYNMMQLKHLDLIASSKVNIDEIGNHIGNYAMHIKTKQMQYLLPYDNSICHPSVIMKKSVLLDLKGYRNIFSCEDYDLWIRMLCRGYRMEIIPHILLKYRVREDSITRTNEYKRYISESYVKKLYKHYKKYKNIPSIQHFAKYSKIKLADKNSESRFNHAYRQYRSFIQSITDKKFVIAIFYFSKSLCTDIRILRVFLSKICYHIRKRIILR